MKPKIFRVDKVFNDFDRKGKVATYRTSYPDETEFWIRRSRTSEKEFEARLVEVLRVDEEDPIPFRKAHRKYPTGFQNPRDWAGKVRRMYDGRIPSGWILFLEKIDGEVKQ